MSFFGGGTDFYEYYSEFGGSVLSATIDKYCYLSMRVMPPFFDYKNQFTYSRIERFNSYEEVRHPLVRAAYKYMNVNGIQLAYDADLPAGSGIASSSAFAVGLLQGLHAMKNEYPDKETLAKEAIHVERVMCDEAGGIQDQIATAYGGFNRIDMTSDGFDVIPINASHGYIKTFQNNLMMLFTGFTHLSGQVSAQQKKNIRDKLTQLHEIKQMVSVAQRLLEIGDVDGIGRLLDHTWALKRSLSDKISTSEIDAIYEKARRNGALGGKILGSGGGGFLLLYVVPEKREELLKSFDGYKIIPFEFEYSGSTILYEGSGR